ncbi:STAS domain-containing protein [Streptomyces specialis]|uniref:STAS domain-containing protein n=1 Tax=Streptomyces specialis TaxID=498367 RepID=UPI00073E1750|nr:STAS domain-containing protein [Streptomyces specialis]
MTAVDAFHTTVFSVRDRVTVSAAGELDFATLPRLRTALAAALATRPRSVDVDLSGVSFCDCAGVNVLLWARGQAVAEGIAFRVTGTGAPVVARLFHLLRVGHLFALDRAR